MTYLFVVGKKNKSEQSELCSDEAKDPNCDTSEPPLALGGSFCAKGVHNLILRWNNLTI